MYCFKNSLMVKLFSVVIIVSLMGSNIVTASGGLDNNFLAIDAGQVLRTIIPQARVLIPALALHAGVDQAGVSGMPDLVKELAPIKERLVAAGHLSAEDADNYLAMSFDDPKSDRPVYYYFNRDGYFLRITNVGEQVNDGFFTGFLRLRGQQQAELVTLNGFSIERFIVPAEAMRGIDLCLKRLYGRGLYDDGPDSGAVLTAKGDGDQPEPGDRGKGSPAECLRDLYQLYSNINFTVADLVSTRKFSERTVRTELRILEELGLVEIDRSRRGFVCRLNNRVSTLSERVVDQICSIPELNLADPKRSINLVRIKIQEFINEIDREDIITRRAVALGYVLNAEGMDLIPGLPAYPKLPRIKDPVFQAGIAQTAKIKGLLLQDEGLANVVFGLKNVSQVSLDLSADEYADLEYALLLLKHMVGISIKVFPLAKSGSYCVYDEDYCRAAADPVEGAYTATRLGLELLIRRDLVRKRGVFHNLAESEVEADLAKRRGRIVKGIIAEDEKPVFRKRLDIEELYFPTYERPDALDRALTAQTRNLELFGHKKDITLVIVDTSPDRVRMIDGGEVNFYEQNMRLVEKFRRRGFKIKYIGAEEVDAWRNRVYQRMKQRYLRQYQEGTIDPRVKQLLFTGSGEIKQSASGSSADLLQEIVFASLNIKNIAGKRTVIQAMSQGKKIASVDDDALPMTRIPNRRNLGEILERRRAKVTVAVSRLYEELSRVPGIQVSNMRDFERLLADLSKRKYAAVRDQVMKMIEKYYAYSPGGQTGVVPRAAEQLVGRAVERRLRFDRILHDGLAESLVVSEDTGTATYQELPEIDNTEYYDWVPVDYLSVFDETLGATIGSPQAGRVFRRDLRGIAGEVAPGRSKARVLLATSHFGGDRDNSAEGLFVEAMDRWQRDGAVTTRYLQQVVRKAVFVEVDGSVSTELDNGNQFCFNTTSLDNTEFPIPTTGAWLRIEEPFQFSLLQLVMQGAMAWSRTVGGHERCPGSRRPKLEMQMLWEECAMVLYRNLDRIAKTVMDELKDVSDPAERIRYLGQRYLEEAAVYEIPSEEEESLRQTCSRIVEHVNRLYAFSEAATSAEDKAELLSLFGEFDESPFGFIKQFSLGVYEFEVQADGRTAKYTKRVPQWQHHWEPASLVESYEWEIIDSGEVDLSSVDWEGSPEIVMPDGTRVKLTSYTDVPRAVPSVGYTFKAVVADPARQADLIQKAREVIQKQFTWDGQQLLVWADVLAASNNFYEEREVGEVGPRALEESNEREELAKNLTVLMGREVNPSEATHVMRNEFASAVSEFTGINFLDRERFAREVLRKDPAVADELVDKFLEAVAIGLVRTYNKRLADITLKEFNSLFGVCQIVLASGFGQRYSQYGLNHKAFGEFPLGETNVRLAMTGAYSSQGTSRIVGMGKYSMRKILKDEVLERIDSGVVRLDDVVPIMTIIPEEHIDPEKKARFVGADVILMRCDSREGYGANAMGLVEMVIEQQGEVGDFRYVQLVYCENGTVWDQDTENISLESWMTAVTERNLVTVGLREDKLVEGKGTPLFVNESGELVVEPRDSSGRPRPLGRMVDWRNQSEERKEALLRQLLNPEIPEHRDYLRRLDGFGEKDTDDPEKEQLIEEIHGNTREHDRRTVMVNANCAVYDRGVVAYFEGVREEPEFAGQRDDKTDTAEYSPLDMIYIVHKEYAGSERKAPVGYVVAEGPSSAKDMWKQNEFNRTWQQLLIRELRAIPGLDISGLSSISLDFGKELGNPAESLLFLQRTLANIFQGTGIVLKGRVHLSAGSRIGASTMVSDSCLLAGAVIGSNCSLMNATIENEVIADNTNKTNYRSPRSAVAVVDDAYYSFCGQYYGLDANADPARRPSEEVWEVLEGKAVSMLTSAEAEQESNRDVLEKIKELRSNAEGRPDTEIDLGRADDNEYVARVILANIGLLNNLWDQDPPIEGQVVTVPGAIDQIPFWYRGPLSQHKIAAIFGKLLYHEKKKLNRRVIDHIILAGRVAVLSEMVRINNGTYLDKVALDGNCYVGEGWGVIRSNIGADGTTVVLSDHVLVDGRKQYYRPPAAGDVNSLTQLRDSRVLAKKVYLGVGSGVRVAGERGRVLDRVTIKGNVVIIPEGTKIAPGTVIEDNLADFDGLVADYSGTTGYQVLLDNLRNDADAGRFTASATALCLMVRNGAGDRVLEYLRGLAENDEALYTTLLTKMLILSRLIDEDIVYRGFLVANELAPRAPPKMTSYADLADRLDGDKCLKIRELVGQLAEVGVPVYLSAKVRFGKVYKYKVVAASEYLDSGDPDGQARKLGLAMLTNSVVKNYDDIIMLLQARLEIAEAGNVSELTARQMFARWGFSSLATGRVLRLFKAVFGPEDDLGLAVRNIKFVCFRGGRGAKPFLVPLKELSRRLGIDLSILEVPGATDDGRSWLLSSILFRATGMPDIGKCLVDIAQDERLAAMVSGSDLAQRINRIEHLYALEKPIAEWSDGHPLTKALKGYASEGEGQKAKVETIRRFVIAFIGRLREIRNSLPPVETKDVLIQVLPELRHLMLSDPSKMAVENWNKFLDNLEAYRKKSNFAFAPADVERIENISALLRKPLSGNGAISRSDLEDGMEENLTAMSDQAKRELLYALFSANMEIPGYGIPVRSMILVGGYLTYRGDYSRDEQAWQKSVDVFGRMLDIKGEVIPATLKRYHLFGLIDDAAAQELPSEDAFNEVDKNGPYFYTTLIGHPLTLEQKRRLRGRTPAEKRALLDSFFTDAVATNPRAIAAIDEANIVGFFPTTLFSNIGSAMIAPGVGEAVRRSRAMRAYIPNSRIEHDEPTTDALTMLEDLYRLIAVEQRADVADIEWSDVGETFDYVIGRVPCLYNAYCRTPMSAAMGFGYINPREEAIAERGVRAVNLDIEDPKMSARANYFTPPLIRAIFQLYSLSRLGLEVSPEGGLRSNVLPPAAYNMAWRLLSDNEEEVISACEDMDIDLLAIVLLLLEQFNADERITFVYERLESLKGNGFVEELEEVVNSLGHLVNPFADHSFKSLLHWKMLLENLFYDDECEMVQVDFVFKITGTEDRVFSLNLPRTAAGLQGRVVDHYLATYLYDLMGGRGTETVGVYCEDSDFTAELLARLERLFPADVVPTGKPGYSHMRKTLRDAYQRDGGFYRASREEARGEAEEVVEVEEAGALPALEALKESRGVVVGIDAGGTDLKLAIYRDGELIYHKEHNWTPKTFTEAEMHLGSIEALIKLGLISIKIAQEQDVDLSAELAGLEDSKTSIDRIRSFVRKVEDRYGTDFYQQLDAVGISWPDIIIGERIVNKANKVQGLMNLADPEQSQAELDRITGMEAEISGRFNDVPVGVINDGNVGAFWASVELGRGNVVGLSMGTSCGAGYVDSNGETSRFLTDMGGTVINMTEDPATAHSYSGIPGSAQKHLSQQGVFRLAEQFGLDVTDSKVKRYVARGYAETHGISLSAVPESEIVAHVRENLPTMFLDEYAAALVSNSEKLKYIQSLLDSSDDVIRQQAERIFKEIGRYLACFIEHTHMYFDKDGTDNYVIFGRVTRGKAGKLIITTAQQFMQHNFTWLPEINIQLAPDITDNPDADRVGQAIGAAYFGYRKLLRLAKKNIAATRMQCEVMPYPWGDTEFIASLQGRTSTGEPEAELWMGAHKKAPAVVKVVTAAGREVAVNLNVLIANAPEEILGPEVTAELGAQLPFLFKVLAAAKPLSIQAHPNKDQAQAGFAREDAQGIPLSAGNRNYKDDNHKPELICAQTDFYALKGFRHLGEIRNVLERCQEFRSLMPDFGTRLGSASEEERRQLLRELYTCIMTMEQERVDSILRPFIQRLRDNEPPDGYPKNMREYWVLKSDQEFCNAKHKDYCDEKGHREHKDRGIFSIYLLNLIHLRPGEALYLPAGELHAYLDGVGLEIMANSDNVLRGGLTPKHVAVPELLASLNFETSDPRQRVRLRRVSDTETVYDVESVDPGGVTEFELSHIKLDDDNGRYVSPETRSADVLLLVAGEIELKFTLVNGAEVLQTYRKGEVILVPASMRSYSITAISTEARLYKASPNMSHLLLQAEEIGQLQPEAQVEPEIVSEAEPQQGPIGKKVRQRITTPADIDFKPNTVIVTPEVDPFSRTGGMASVAAETAKYGVDAGVPATVITLKYDNISEELLEDTGLTFNMRLAGEEVLFKIWTAQVNNVTYYFLDDDKGYTSRIYDGNQLRQSLALSEGSLKAMEVLCAHEKIEKPQVVHTHDWQAGLLPVFLKTKYQRHPFFCDIASIFTIHNLAYQGEFDGSHYDELGIDGSHWFGLVSRRNEHKFNVMRGAIFHADKVNTVSPTYAQEIQTAEFGEGLELDLISRNGDLEGIINAVDVQDEEFDLRDKPAAKAALQREFGLDVDPDIPIFSMITRVTEHKGVEMCLRVIRQLLEETKGDIQFAMIGSGHPDDPYYHRCMKIMEELNSNPRWRGKVKCVIAFDYALTSRVLKGSDVFLMPSVFEPCGITQQKAMAYGTIPVVRKTGGLADTVTEYDSVSGAGNGFLFEQPNDRTGFYNAVERAMAVVRDPVQLAAIRRTAQESRPTWHGSIDRYVGLYQEAVRRKSAYAFRPEPEYQELWEADISAGSIVEWRAARDAEKHPDIDPKMFMALSDVIKNLVKDNGLGIVAVIDAIRVVNNIGTDRLQTGEDGVVPYAMMAREADGRNVLLLDIDSFADIRLLYLLVEHELQESIMTVIPSSSEAVRELTTNYMTLKLALEKDFRLDRGLLTELGVDLQFLAALEALYGEIEPGREITKEEDKRKILVVALEHMRTMPYYEALFRAFPFADDWSTVMRGVVGAENQYQAALAVFGDVMEASVAVQHGMTARVDQVKRDLDHIAKEVEVNVKVVKTFTGRMRIIGLEKLSKGLQKMIGVTAKQIHSTDILAGQLTRVDETKYLLLDEVRLAELREAIGAEEYERMRIHLSENNYQLCTEQPEDVAVTDIIRLVDPVDLHSVTQTEGMLYLPMPYTRSAVYMAAGVVAVNGDPSRVDGMVRGFIISLYSGILGRPIAVGEAEGFLEQLFSRPWEFLPEIRRVSADLGILRRAALQIERSA